MFSITRLFREREGAWQRVGGWMVNVIHDKWCVLLCFTAVTGSAEVS